MRVRTCAGEQAHDASNPARGPVEIRAARAIGQVHEPHSGRQSAAGDTVRGSVVDMVADESPGVVRIHGVHLFATRSVVQ